MWRKILLVSCVACFAVTVSGPPAGAQDWLNAGFFFEPSDTVVPRPAELPPRPDCTTWHEAWPEYCLVVHQDGYEDDGDGDMTPCDHITINGIRYHVEQKLLTYHVNDVDDPEYFAKFAGEVIPGGNPIGETWHEIYPDYCKEWYIEDWLDNGNGQFDACDIVVSGGKEWHLNAITPGLLVDVGVPSTGRTGTLALIAILALTGLILVFRARRRAARTGG